MVTLDFKDFDGLKLPTEFHLIREKIEHFEVRNEDVWVTSYPKTGTTWCQEMVWLIVNDLDFEGAKVNLNQRSHFIEYNGIMKEGLRFCKTHNIPTKFADISEPDIMKIACEIPGKRIIKTHLPWEFLPRQITDGIKTPKIVHIMRNPKQVAPSYYNHTVMVFPSFIGNLEQFVDFYIEGKLLYGDYFRNVLSYWKQRNQPNLLIITYEEMHTDLTAVIRKVSNFLGKSYDEEDVKKLTHHLSFDEMKKNSAVNLQNTIHDEKVHFIRKGSTNSYKQELTPQMIHKLDQWVAENIKGTGLPYEDS